jgi:hypothetical protein
MQMNLRENAFLQCAILQINLINFNNFILNYWTKKVYSMYKFKD